jgi:hypothetical protein
MVLRTPSSEFALLCSVKVQRARWQCFYVEQIRRNDGYMFNGNDDDDENDNDAVKHLEASIWKNYRSFSTSS